MKRYVVVLAVVLAGCSTAAEREITRISESRVDAAAREQMCIAKMRNSPEFRELSSYLPEPGMATVSPSLLTNDFPPSPEQSATLVRYRNQYMEPCQSETLANAQKIHPAISSVLSQSYALGDLGFAKLAARQMTWAQYAEFYSLLMIGSKQEMAKVTQGIRREYNTAHTAEVARRQAAFANLSNVGTQLMIMGQQQQMIDQNQQMINAMNRPVTTNCRYVGRQLVCNSF